MAQCFASSFRNVQTNAGAPPGCAVKVEPSNWAEEKTVKIEAEVKREPETA